MNAQDFLTWLGDQLEILSQTPTANHQRYHFIQGMMELCFVHLEQLSAEDRHLALKSILESSDTRAVGTYRIPYDDRDTFDWVEGVIATVIGFLE